MEELLDVHIWVQFDHTSPWRTCFFGAKNQVKHNIYVISTKRISNSLIWLRLISAFLFLCGGGGGILLLNLPSGAMWCDITFWLTRMKRVHCWKPNYCLGGIRTPLNPSIPTVKEPSLICGSIDCYFWIIVMFWCLRVSTGFENHFHWSLIILQCHMLTFAWFNMTPDIYIHLNMISFCRSPSFSRGLLPFRRLFSGAFHFYYCWWKTSCNTWNVKFPVKNGMTYPSSAAGFLLSTVPFWEFADWTILYLDTFFLDLLHLSLPLRGIGSLTSL